MRKPNLTRVLPQYGGLEPYLTSLVSPAIALSFESESIEQLDSNIAYLSLHSFTLGSTPPLFKGLRVTNQTATTADIHLDVDFTSKTFSLILALKLSSLSHVMLPTTLLEVTDVSLPLPLVMSYETGLHYPFLKSGNISVEYNVVDELTFKVRPVDESSGMRGIDLGNIPGVTSFIKENVRAVVEDMVVSPNYLHVSGRRAILPRCCDVRL